MKIFFYHCGPTFDGNATEEKPLGGTESALIYVARALTELHHAVTVFTNTSKEGYFHQVPYLKINRFEESVDHLKPDVVIIWRSLVPLMAKRWAPVQIYFSPDAIDQSFLTRAFALPIQHNNQSFEVGLYALNYSHRFADAVFCVGNWQAQSFIRQFKIPAEKVFVVHNGVSLSEFNTTPKPRKRQIVYASTPFRGLDHLLKYFPEIRKQVPDATCAVMSGMQLYGASAQEDQDNFGALYKLADQPGVTLHGPLVKKEMSKIFSESRMMAYPNTFAETFCIAALEAQASGLPVVSTDLGAMSERVNDGVDGFLIKGMPTEENYRNQFIEKTVQLLTDDSMWKKMSDFSHKKASEFSYQKVALHWQSILNRLIESGTPKEKINWSPSSMNIQLNIQGVNTSFELKKEMILAHYVEYLKAYGLVECANNLLVNS